MPVFIVISIVIHIFHSPVMGVWSLLSKPEPVTGDLLRPFSDPETVSRDPAPPAQTSDTCEAGDRKSTSLRRRSPMITSCWASASFCSSSDFSIRWVKLVVSPSMRFESSRSCIKYGAWYWLVYTLRVYCPTQYRAHARRVLTMQRCVRFHSILILDLFKTVYSGYINYECISLSDKLSLNINMLPVVDGV